MPTATTRTIEIASSPRKMILLVAASVLMAATSAAIPFRWLPGLAPDPVMVFVGYFGLVFFGLCTIVIAWRLLSARGPVVTITPEGIRDTRVAAEFIP